MFNLPFRSRQLLLLLPAVLLASGAHGQAVQAPLVVERQGAESVRAGERFEYELTVRNQSDVPVTDVRIEEFVPGRETQGRQQTGSAGQRAAAAQPDQGISRTIPFLAPGESKRLTVSGVARQEGTIRSCMGVEYTPAVCTSMEVVKPDVSLRCEMSDTGRAVYEPDVAENFTGTTAYACDELALACQVTNEGTGATRPGQLALNLSDGLRPADGSPATLEIASIDPGESVQETIRLEPVRAGTYRIRPTLQTGTGTIEAAPIAVRVIQPQLELAVQAPAEEYVNRPVSYMVHLRNPGAVAVPETRLRIDSPETLQNVSISSEGMPDEEGTYSLGVLPAGASRSITVTGDAAGPGTAALRAAADGYCVTAKEQTAQVALRGVPALVVIAYDERDPVAVGEETVYDIKIKNQGTASAGNVRLAGTLGNQFEFVSGGGETDVEGSGGRFDIGTLEQLAPGESAGWTVTAKAKSSGYGRMKLEMASSATKRPVVEQEPTRVIN